MARRPTKEPASRSLGMREIARRLGVAPITVSRAVRTPELVLPATRDRILDLIKREGFVPNQLAGSMRSPSRIIGTMVPPLINSGIAEQVQGMSDACQEHGYQLLLIQGDFVPELEERAIRALLGWRPAGLILQAFVQSPTARALLRDSNRPVVEISEIKGRRPIDMAVGVSNLDAAYAMTAHLADKGYKHIGFVSTPIHGNDRLRQRRIGYRRALADRGLAYHPTMEVEMPITPQGGGAAMRVLTGLHPELDVIFCSSDVLAIGAVQECHRLGWAVPGRLAIAGYGDADLAQQLFPSLTTVRVARHQMGRQAVDLLVRRLSGDPRAPKVIRIGFEVVGRDSA